MAWNDFFKKESNKHSEASGKDAQQSKSKKN